MQKANSSTYKQNGKSIKMKYCKNYGWKMEYRPRSFQEYINEIIKGENKR